MPGTVIYNTRKLFLHVGFEPRRLSTELLGHHIKPEKEYSIGVGALGIIETVF